MRFMSKKQSQEMTDAERRNKIGILLSRLDDLERAIPLLGKAGDDARYKVESPADNNWRSFFISVRLSKPALVNCVMTEISLAKAELISLGVQP